MIFIFYRDLRIEDNTSLLKLIEINNITNIKDIGFACIVDPIINTNKFVKQTFYDIIKSLSTSLNIEIKLFTNPNTLLKHILAQTKLKKDNEAFTVAFNKNLLIWEDFQKVIINELNNEKKCNIICEEDYTILPSRLSTNKQGKPYKVYTPFYRHYIKTIRKTIYNLVQPKPTPGFLLQGKNTSSSKLREQGLAILSRVITGDFNDYKQTRNIPSNKDGTTKLGKYISFGVISIREVFTAIPPKSSALISEVIWRDYFYFCNDHIKSKIKANSMKKPKPHNRGSSWSWSDAHNFIKAGIKELMETGWVNNRLRMIIVMFMLKTKGLSQQYATEWFSRYMVDYYESSNNGGIFWAMRQPAFRNFNYDIQYKKYDSSGRYTNDILSQKKLTIDNK